MVELVFGLLNLREFEGRVQLLTLLWNLDFLDDSGIIEDFAAFIMLYSVLYRRSLRLYFFL